MPSEHRELCEALPLDEIGDYAPEVAYALDLRTGRAREIGRGINRAYGELSDDEIAGTADAVKLLSPTTVYVGDFKSGWGWVPRARDN